ncbi:MAG TPA: chitobiase/beta-hexosaminidase C-terminal domain-containing protein, partial [Candidatus Cloacimonadota bacterium]|nr:chitobiase/beta-hexosaminidase C-terminal domain-containing protein [Candidatus Cloacimonadota bacterium]
AAPIIEFDPLNSPLELAIYHNSTIVWWAAYTAPDPDYLISDIHRYPIPVKNRTKMTYWGGGNDSVFDPPAGTYTTPVDVFINTTTLPANAPVWYTIDGGAPQLYLGGPVTIDESAVLVAYASPMPPLTTLESLHQTASYNITGTLPVPIIVPDGFPTVQMYEDNILVTITIPDANPLWAGATIRYTINGDDPTIASPEYTGPIPLNQGHWQVRAKAFLTDWEPSSVAHTEYFVKFLPEVTFAPLETTHYSNINVEMYAYDGAQIRYTENGEDPTAGSPLYGGPLPLAIDPMGPYTRTYTVRAFLPGWVTSNPVQITYTMIPTVADPIFAPAATQHDVPITITLDSATPGATIWYTLDSSDPGPDNPNSMIYSAPGINLGTTTVVRAIAIKDGFRDSEIVRKEYVIGSNIGALVFTPPAGTYRSPQDVSIITSPPTAEIWYTTDGTDPDPGVNGTLYEGPISLGTGTQTLINAVAVLPFWTSNSGQAFYNITGKLDVPELLPASNQYTLGTNVDVTITAPVTAPGSMISYSVNNGPYTTAPSPVEFTINSNTTVVAKAVMDDWDDSDPVTATYIFNPALNPPLISPVSGTYYTPVQVVIYSTNPGSEIFYTLDPDPLVIPDILYTYGVAGFTLNGSGVVRAISKKANWLDSTQAQANYILKAPVPVFDPPAGTYAESQNVVITGDGSSDIWYTLDGSVPSPDNPNAFQYLAPIPVNGYTRIRAVAVRTDWQNSDIVEAIYTINGQLTAPVFSINGGTFMEPVSLSITASPAGASIYYWLNGAIADSTLYTVPIPINENTQVRARSFLANWLPSNSASADFFLKVKPISA